MLCKKPFIKGDAVFPCGQCLPCRLNRRRLWTHRIILEAMKHEKNCFPTLTYSDESLPPGGNLFPRHLVLFIKSLREAIRPNKLRYYAVGEYGDQTQRPHYHLAVFGLGPDSADLMQTYWPHGHIFMGELSLESAQYISGYVTKKMTAPDDPRLYGRYPEFARMSRKPGIGAGAIDELKDFFNSKLGQQLLMQTGDVPLALRHGGKQLPLGRYLRRKLREVLEIPEQGTANPFLQNQIAEMSLLFESSEARTRWQKLAAYQKSTKSKIRSVETRHKIFESKGKKL